MYFNPQSTSFLFVLFVQSSASYTFIRSPFFHHSKRILNRVHQHSNYTTLKMVKKDLSIVVAVSSSNRGIGYQGQLPWKLPGDMQHFKQVTTETIDSSKKNAVIMGRKTWDSIPEKFRPLPGRLNVVLTRQQCCEKPTDDSNNIFMANSLDDACAQLDDMANIEKVFIIGGSQIYDESLKTDRVTSVLYTEVSNLPETTKFDTFFPELNKSEWDRNQYISATSENCLPSNANNKPVLAENEKNNVHTDSKSGVTYQFLEYRRRDKDNTITNPQSPVSITHPNTVTTPNEKVDNTSATAASTTATIHEEMQYLNLCRDVLDNGIKRGDRTGTGTLSKFGTQMRFSLRNGTIPVLTTKRTFWRGVAEELLWFISGNTNANVLAEKDIHIWDGNGSREFLDSRGLQHRDVGDLGPVYGFQWRHFGAKYETMFSNYTGQGFDQLADCIHKIINNPEDRRIIMSAWNPNDLNDMALPPCHMFCQFYVDTTSNEVSCQMYQRSADLGLGVPFNIASYALLTHLIAYVTGRQPGDFIHTIGDAHIYLNHIDALEEQLQRTPRPFPTLKINPSKDNPTIDDFTMDDFELVGYNPYGPIKMKMAV